MNRRVFFATMTTVFLLSVSGYSSAQSKRIRKYVIVPAWRIQLLDSAGNPVKKAVVRQIWKDYDVEEDSHEEDLEVDDHGYVRFPERSVKTSPKAKALGRARHGKELGVHASFGPDAYVLAWTDELEGFINYKVGEPLPTHLIMRPKKVLVLLAAMKGVEQVHQPERGSSTALAVAAERPQPISVGSSNGMRATADRVVTH